MSPDSQIKDHRIERQTFVNRVIFTTIIGVLFLSFVIARLMQLQISQHDKFTEQSQGNRIRISTISPTRGLIFDRNGKILAENIPAYQLEIIPEQVSDVNETLQKLSEINIIKEENISQIIGRIKQSEKFKPVILRFRLTDEEIAKFSILRPHLPGVDFRPNLIRNYPNNHFTAHAIGYVGAMSKQDIERLDMSNYASTSHTGKTGIELFYEKNLYGKSGYKQIVTNAQGRLIESKNPSNPILDIKKPYPGSNIHLTIDLNLQVLATNLLNGKRGSIVAIDPNNGEILALVSAPSFNPNIFTIGMSVENFNNLENNISKPLFNRAVLGSYPPGSTIKPILGLAGLKTGATNITKRIFCRGYFSLPGSTHRYRDWLQTGHGNINFEEAITESCDVYFYEISGDIGIDRMHYYLNQFGLGQKTNIDMIGENTGLIPSTRWKKESFRDRNQQKWYPGETVIASIGQGYMLATPLQLASATATLSMKGKRFRPHLTKYIEDPLTKIQTLPSNISLANVNIEEEKYWNKIISAMHNVMQKETGTAYKAGENASYNMAGKSGTAQVFSIAQEEEYDDEVIERLRDHALFISFAPIDKPAIAVAVIVENGSSGSTVAAPIAREIMDYYIGPRSDAL